MRQVYPDKNVSPSNHINVWLITINSLPISFREGNYNHSKKAQKSNTVKRDETYLKMTADLSDSDEQTFPKK